MFSLFFRWKRLILRLRTLIINMSSAISGTVSVSNWCPDLIPGPEWRSFEQFRTAGPAALEMISPGSVGILRVKGTTFNILGSVDFQKLVGLASEVHRLKEGITLILTAAKLVHKYPNDPDQMEMLYKSASLLRESSMLPERIGHDEFHITEDECKEHGQEDNPIRASEILRPTL
jgi:hypothetical protein